MSKFSQIICVYFLNKIICLQNKFYYNLEMNAAFKNFKDDRNRDEEGKIKKK